MSLAEERQRLLLEHEFAELRRVAALSGIGEAPGWTMVGVRGRRCVAMHDGARVALGNTRRECRETVRAMTAALRLTPAYLHAVRRAHTDAAYLAARERASTPR